MEIVRVGYRVVLPPGWVQLPVRTNPAAALDAQLERMRPESDPEWDAAFDTGLVSFDPVGAVLFSPALGEAARARLGDGRLRTDRPLTAMHRSYLAWHLTRIFKA